MSFGPANTSAPSGAGTGASPSTSSSGGSAPTPSSNAHTARDFRKAARAPTPEPASEPVSQPSEPVSEPSSPEPDAEPALEPDVEPEAAAEAEEEDFSWLEQLKAHKELHGVPLTELVQALAEGRLPDALLDKIKLKLKNGDEEYEDTIATARKERMLHRDYTQKLQAWGRERDEFNSDKEEFINMLHSWKGNPEALVTGLERLDFPVLDAAKLVAAKHRMLAEMTPNERALYEENEQLKRAQSKVEFEQRRAQIQSSESQIKTEGEKRAAMVSQVAKGLFDKTGLPLDERSWRVFLNKFSIISDSYPPGTAWTTEMIENAFDAAAYDIRAALTRRDQLQASANPPKPKQHFESPAREQVAQLSQPPRSPTAGVRRKDAGMRGSEFRKTFLGR